MRRINIRRKGRTFAIISSGEGQKGGFILGKSYGK
jgi:hypothetical protein